MNEILYFECDLAVMNETNPKSWLSFFYTDDYNEKYFVNLRKRTALDRTPRGG